MKTLVIHPPDPTTNFLSSVYPANSTIIRTDIGDSLLKKLIRRHDRVVMLGHGTDQGLIGYDRFLVSSDFVQELQGKDCIAIWCYASSFIQKYSLKSSFSTGMFISENDEAYHEGIIPKTDEIEDSNYLFADALESFLLTPKPDRKDLEAHYIIGGVSPIVQYNLEQFYSSSSY